MPYKNRTEQLNAQQKHYRQNKAIFKQRLVQRRHRNKNYVWACKAKSTCSQCKENNPSCLDYHHLFGKAKTIAQLIRNGASIATIDNEMQKCVVLCTNCHCKQHRPIQIKDGSSWPGFRPYRIAKRKWFIQWLQTQQCQQCRMSDTRCLEFHHVDESNKRFKISYLLTSGHSLAFLQDEISKCIVLCANCHRKLHG